jgi:uncharacterized protein (DUF2336 family)
VVDSPETEAGIRDIPMTRRLAAVLRRIRHLGSDAVLVQDDGRPMTTKALRKWRQNGAGRYPRKFP